MPQHSRSLATATLAALLMAGCTTLGHADRAVCYERTLALPVDVAAALAGSAVRQMFPFADPLPQAAGAPANWSALGFEIVYEQACCGTWLPVASHRLRIAAVDGNGPLQVLTAQLVGNQRLPSPSGAARRLEILCTHGRDGGCAIRATLPPGIAAQVRETLDRTFALATAADAPPLGLSEPNLRTFVCHRLLAAAAVLLRAGAPQRAAEQLHLASRLVEGAPALQRRLGALALRCGDADLARTNLRESMLVAADPATRAKFGALLATLDRRDPTTNLEAGVAELVAHTARRQSPEPVRDYERQRHLHAQRPCDMGELACALLAREHGPGASSLPDMAGALLPRRPFDLAQRLAIGDDARAIDSAAQPSVAAPAR